ncbi:hypothetical protein [Comamonas humi]
MAGLSLPAVHPGTSGNAVVAEGGKEDEHKQLYPERLHLALASSDQMKGLDAAAFCAATAAAMGCAAAGTFPYQERPTPAMSAVAANRVLLVTEPPAIGTTPKLAAYFSTNTEVRINQ